ncbi:hypothetical protein B0T16DRAFT_460807 [Cercophora newfieldiana]|uniref:Uncharacterized protein n=1 Tax=Cercophora newfieldiana TaxID=92897 RepID=A0AA40CIZ2_9PEZI|nr:hypothetical protein B0T16DRAFT_460807 [Cercophora newfieldiana]
MAGTDNPPGVEPTESGIPTWVPDLYAFTQAPTRHIYFRHRQTASTSIMNLPIILDANMSLTCDAIPLPFGEPLFSTTVNQLRETPIALKEYTQQAGACNPFCAGVPPLQALFSLLLSLDDSQRYDRMSAPFDSHDAFLLQAGLKFYTALVPPEDGLADVPYAPELMEEFLAAFLGSRDFTLRPEWDHLRQTLRFDYDDLMTSVLVHALQAVREEIVFGTQDGHLGLCSFPLSEEDEFFVVPGCSSALVLRWVADHHVLRGPYISRFESIID